MIVMPDGPIPARIMICGEAPGETEERMGAPFQGASGQELNKMLHEAGILRSECFCTNVCRIRPQWNKIDTFIALKKKDITPHHHKLRNKYVLDPILEGMELLEKEIKMVQPNVIIAAGNLALWALTGEWGVLKWRGSLMRTDLWKEGGDAPKVIPIIHPAAILRQWELRTITINDLRRVAEHRTSRTYNEPKWNFILQPSFERVMTTLNDLLAVADQEEMWIDFDLETSIKYLYIKCAGISWGALDAMCIPFTCEESPSGYWRVEEEASIVHALYRLLTHKNVKVRGQNLLFDAQYTYRYWHFIPNVKQDTMISHHVAFAGLPKRLDFQASMYCEHYTQWKPDKQAWKEGG